MSAADPLRQLPLHERHAAHGARFAPFAGWDMPLQYQGVIEEHRAVREQAGIFDVSHMGRVLIEGPESGSRLRAVTTFDVQRLAPGEAHYSLYCTAEGGIADDVFVYRLDVERWLVVHNAANAVAGFARVSAAAPGARDVTAETVMLAVQGPDALRHLGEVIGAAEALAALEPRHCLELAWRDASLIVGRTGYTGEDGAECIAPVEAGPSLWDALVAAGVQPAGLGARDTLRLEAALPLHGHDIDESTNPYEAGLGWAVPLEDAAPFTGRAALERLHETPPSRRLSCLRLLERAVPRAGQAVLDAAGGSAPVSILTSGTFSPTLRTGIGMAYLPVELSRPGTPLAVLVRERAVAAEVVRRPFYRRGRS